MRKHLLLAVLTASVFLAGCDKDQPNLGSGNMLALTTETTPRVVGFDRANPASLLSTATITGLALPAEIFLGLDVRATNDAQNGTVFVLTRDGAATTTGKLYTLNPSTGALTQYCTIAGLALAANTQTTLRWGVDFNPTANSANLRVINTAPDTTAGGANDLSNLSVAVPAAGGGATACVATAQTDFDAANQAGVLTAAGYTNTVSTTTPATVGNTRLFYVDTVSATAALRSSNNPAANVSTAVGTNLGITTNAASGNNGFDVNSNSNVATLALNDTVATVAATRVYAVSLVTGAATLLGTLGDGTFGIAGMTTRDVTAFAAP